MRRRSVIPDPFRFAVEGRSITGTIPLAELERVGDMLLDRPGEVTYVLSGEVGLDRKARLRLKASGVFPVQCQRCLGRIDWPMEIETVLELVRPGQPIPEHELENDEVDVIEATSDMDVPALVEDEIVLGLPLAPRHENCDMPRPAQGSQKESPFVTLARLQKKDGAE
jgi:uncharacterized protein